MRIKVNKKKTLLDALRSRLVGNDTMSGNAITSRYPSHNRSYDLEYLGLSEPLDSIFLSLFTASERLKNTSIDSLLRPFHDSSQEYTFPDFEKHLERTRKKVKYKSDSIGLDVLLEKEIVEFLISAESYPDSFIRRESVFKNKGVDLYNFKPTFLPPVQPRAVISEECGLFPLVNNINETVQLFVTDPLDGSSIAKGILNECEGKNWSEKIRNYLSTQPGLIVPNASVACIENGKVTSNVIVDLARNIYYFIDNNGAFISRSQMIRVDRYSEPEIRVYLSTPKLRDISFRDFSESDLERFVCHTDNEDYKQNLTDLHLPGNLRRYNLKSTPGPMRPLFLTHESKDIKPRFVLYNGEKIAEWIGSLIWAESSDKLNVYAVSNPNAPAKGGYSMAPLPDKSIFGLDGKLDFSSLNGSPNPAQYRSTIGIVYKEDAELNYHFKNKLNSIQIG